MCVLDVHVLKLLPGGSEVLKKILDIFLRSSEALIVSMEKGVEEGDVSQVALAVHTLKSSSAMVGAQDLSRLCQKIEAIIQNDELAELAVIVQGVRRARQLVEDECQNHYLK